MGVCHKTRFLESDQSGKCCMFETQDQTFAKGLVRLFLLGSLFRYNRRLQKLKVIMSREVCE